MARIYILLLCLAVPSLAGRHYHRHESDAAENKSVSFRSDHSNALNGYAPVAATPSADGSSDPAAAAKKGMSTKCFYMGMVIVFLCACGSSLRSCVGENGGMVLSILLQVGIWWYLIYSGIITTWWQSGGSAVGSWCEFLCIWAIMMTPCILCLTCVLVCCMPAGIVIRNKIIGAFKEEYQKKLPTLSVPRREYYESDAFQNKCARLFREADKDESGELDMQELKDTIEAITKRQLEQALSSAETEDQKRIIKSQSQSTCFILQQAFQASSTCNTEEFIEMMKFVSVMAFQDGRCNNEQAFEIFKLDGEASPPPTQSDISKVYRKMAIRFHPDKQDPDNKGEAEQAMFEINNAKSQLDGYFRALKAWGVHYKVGERVEAHSLKAAGLNGQIGKITEFLFEEDNNRIEVDFGTTLGRKKLKADNLRYPGTGDEVN